MEKYWTRRDFLKKNAAAIATMGMAAPLSSL
ncbi:MAG: twin-arginine translocation signal domain-containing protein, partial [Spirosomataceae bacterium]